MTTASLLRDRPGTSPARRARATVRSRPRLLRIAAAPPERVAEGVWLIRGGLKRTTNVYLLQGAVGVVAFDAGERGMAAAIAAAAARRGGLERIVLGHADTDHRGAAPALGGAPVHCHPDAVAEAEGSGGRSYMRPEKLPWPTRVQQRFLHDYVWDDGPVALSGTVREGDEVAGFEVIGLPGHAPGQIGLWRESDRLALVSDCFYLCDLWGRPVPPRAPHEALNFDSAQARASILKLAALDPATCCPGHLGPLTGRDVRAQLERAAAT
jgi:hydroxyacylglutathione hydrolase